MKISVIMVDGEFRENTFGAEYFSKQDLPENEFEVIWVEYYSKVPDHVRVQKNVRVITLDNPKEKEYHSSFCFNAGIKAATGELLVIPDADQIVEPDFLSKLWQIHSAFDKLVVYPYRYDEDEAHSLTSHDFAELKKKCLLKNPMNYGGCLSVRKKWMMEINGYEQHRIFSSGFHANGSDVYTRLRNLGLAVMWAHEVRLYHPWHEFTRVNADVYIIQKALIDWRLKQLQFLAINGIDPSKNFTAFPEKKFMEKFNQSSAPAAPQKTTPAPGLLRRILNKL